MMSTATPTQAFGFGAGVVAASPKLWAFTLGAIAVIAERGSRAGRRARPVRRLRRARGVDPPVAGGHRVRVAPPRRAALDRVTDLLARYNRPLMIGLGVVFGTWFLLKALAGFGVRGPRAAACYHPGSSHPARPFHGRVPAEHPVTTPTVDPGDVAPAVAALDTIVSLSKRRGFIFPSSEIYGGINAVWDYGPLGVELKNNVKRAWWRAMVQDRDDIVGLDAGILMHPQVWVTCGPRRLVQRPDGRVRDVQPPLPARRAARRGGPERHRPRAIPASSSASASCCPNDGGPLSAPRRFNLMFTSHMGPVEDDASIVYFRPETAQGSYVNFKNVQQSSRKKIPFGIAQIGKSLPQRDLARQLRVPDARVRADGDAVLRPAGGGRVAPPSRSGCRAAAPGTRPTA